jgi:hypothetical protein
MGRSNGARSVSNLNPPRKRRLGAILMLACALAQPAAASDALAGGLALALHGNADAHALMMVSDDGHLDLVLCHGDDDCRGEPSEDASLSEGDHVVHLIDSNDAAARRLGLDPSPPLEVSVALPLARDPRVAACTRPEDCARVADSLRTVVLRL